MNHAGIAASEDTGRPPLRAWAITLFLTLCYSLSLVDRFMLAFVAEPLRADLNLTDTQLGLVQGFAFSIIYAAAGLPLGIGADRFRRTWIVSGSIAVWSVMTATCGLAWSFSSLFLSRIGVGVGEAGLTPAAYSMLGDLFPRRSLPWASMLYTLAPTVATASAAGLSGLLLTAAGPDGVFALPYFGPVRAWRIVMFAIGLPGLLLALSALLIREPARKGIAPRQDAGKGRLIAFLRDHWRLHVVFMIAAMLSVFAGYAVNSWVPSILSRQFHWSAAETGATLGTILLVCGVVGTLGGGALCSWSVARGRDDFIVLVAMVAMVLEILAGGLLFVAHNGEQFLAVSAIVLVTTPLMFMLGPTMLQLVTPADLRGRMIALGLFVSIALGAGAGPLAVGATNEALFAGQALMQSLGLVLLVAGGIGAALFASCIPASRANARNS